MKRLFVLVPLVALAACAQILSYDDYAPRANEAGVAPADASSDAASDSPVDGGDAGPQPLVPPGRPTGERKPSGTGATRWYAVKHFFVGSQNAAGVDEDDAWKYWGFDLDGVCTSLDDSVANVGTCKRHPDAKPDMLQDGLRCRDNNFGHHVVELVRVYSEGFETKMNANVLAGSVTWILRVDDVDPGKDDAYAPGKLYRAASAPSGVVPKWDGSDTRSVLEDSVIGGDVDKAVTEFPDGYVSNGVWVSGDPGAKKIVMPVSGDITLNLALDHAQVAVALDGTKIEGSTGVLVGALPATEIESFVRPVAIQAGFCPGSVLYESLLKTVQRFPDVSIGAPNLQDTTQQCDGISLGIGFEIAPIQPVTSVVPPDPPKPSGCDDAG